MIRFLVLFQFLFLGATFATAENGTTDQPRFTSIGFGTGLDSAPIGFRIQLTSSLGDFAYWGIYGGGGPYTTFAGADMGFHLGIAEAGVTFQESVVFGGVGYFTFLTLVTPYVGADVRWLGKPGKDITFGLRVGKPIELSPRFGFASFPGYEFFEWSILVRIAIS